MRVAESYIASKSLDVGVPFRLLTLNRALGCEREGRTELGSTSSTQHSP